MDDISYHIVIFDGDNDDSRYSPCYDVKFVVDIDRNDTFNDLINKIIVNLTEWAKKGDLDSKQKECTKLLGENRKDIIIKIGKMAKKQKDLNWRRLMNSGRYQEASINDGALQYFHSIKSQCIYWIGRIEKKENKKSRSKSKKQLTTTTRSRQRKRKRTRHQYQELDDNDNDDNNNNNNNNNDTDDDNDDEIESFEKEPPSKRRKKRNKKRNKKQCNTAAVISDEIESVNNDLECLWILIDCSTAISGVYNRRRRKKISRIDKVRECIKMITSTNWPSSYSITHKIGLYGFGRTMINMIEKPLEYTKQNETLIMEKLERIQICPANSMTVLKAVENLTDRILNEKDNIECGRNRIVLFVGKHGEDSQLIPLHNLRINNLKNTLKTAQIIFDVIQVSHSHRPNKDIIKLTEGNGKLWNPSVNLQEWESVVICHDFVHPEQRNVGYQEAILID